MKLHEEYNVGLDIFRIMCCTGVLIYHTVQYCQLVGFAKLIYFSASFCVPGFFLLSGFLLGDKDDLTREYCEKKIKHTMTMLFGWIIFWGVIRYILTGEVIDIWQNFTHGVSSGGILPVAWFIFSYSVLMILAYPLHKLKNRHRLLFIALGLSWAVVLGVVGKIRGSVYLPKSQSMQLHIYGCYFILGMCLSLQKS